MLVLLRLVGEAALGMAARVPLAHFGLLGGCTGGAEGVLHMLQALLTRLRIALAHVHVPAHPTVFGSGSPAAFFSGVLSIVVERFRDLRGRRETGDEADLVLSRPLDALSGVGPYDERRVRLLDRARED